MRRTSTSRFTTMSLGVAVATVSFFTTLQLAAAPPTDPMPVDRTLKSDRLQVRPDLASRPEPALPKGCLTVAEGHTDIFAREVPGRCVA